MTLDQLKYFLVTAKYEHVGKASSQLRLSPSTVSTAIGNLESSLGIKLFRKIGKRIVLTELGRAFKAKAEKIVNEVQVLEEEVTALPHKINRTLHIGATHWLADKTAMPAFLILKDLYPEVDLEIYSLRSAQVIEYLELGKIDLGISFSPLEHPDLKITTIHTGHLIPAVNQNHPQIQQVPANISRLSDFPYASPIALKGIEICEHHPCLDTYQIKSKVDIIFDSYYNAISCVQHSLHWTLLPEIIVNSEPKLATVPVPEDWMAPYKIAFLSRKEQKLGPLENEFLDALKNKINEFTNVSLAFAQ